VERFLVKNFGCRASQADGAAIEAGLTGKGLLSASAVQDADLVVLNTCTVTATADDEVRQTVRRIHREQPLARIVITGCYAQRAPEELAALEGVSLVAGNTHKGRIPDLVTESHYHGQIAVGDIFAPTDFLSAPVADAAWATVGTTLMAGTRARLTRARPTLLLLIHPLLRPVLRHGPAASFYHLSGT